LLIGCCCRLAVEVHDVCMMLLKVVQSLLLLAGTISVAGEGDTIGGREDGAGFISSVGR